jgi:hypothetical protein
VRSEILLSIALKYKSPQPGSFFVAEQRDALVVQVRARLGEPHIDLPCRELSLTPGHRQAGRRQWWLLVLAARLLSQKTVVEVTARGGLPNIRDRRVA